MGHAVSHMVFLQRHSGKAEYVCIYRIGNELILHNPKRHLPGETWRDGVGKWMLIQSFLPLFFRD